jgi:hypothetical protein
LGWYHVFHNDAFDFHSFAAVSFSVLLPSAAKVELEATTFSYVFVDNFGTNERRCSTSNYVYTTDERRIVCTARQRS